MHEFLMIGTVLGALIGLLHAPLVYRSRRRDEGAGIIRSGYFAAWAFCLWTLFGAYVLAFWLVGLAGMVVLRLFRAGSDA